MYYLLLLVPMLLVGNLWSICLEVSILSPLPFVAFIGNIPLLKAIRVNCRPLKRALKLLKVFFYPSFDLGLEFLLKSIILSNRLVWSISASSILILPI